MEPYKIRFFGYSDKDFSVYGFRKYKSLFKIPLKELIFRILLSFVPPITKKYSGVPVDLMGPILGYTILTFVLTYGYFLKNYTLSAAPSKTVLFYLLALPAFTFFCKQITFLRLSLLQIVSIFGYASYGHIATLLISYYFNQSSGLLYFFVYMVLLSGLSTLRVVLILISSIRIPGARLLICSVMSVVNLLFVIYCNFAFMCEYNRKP